MPKDKTQAEIRDEKIDRELFEVTEEMRGAMERARMEDIRRAEDVVEPVMRHKDGTSKPSYTHQSATD